MDNKEAIKALEVLDGGRLREAVNVAIKALEAQDAEDDAISRRAALEACYKGWNKDYKEIAQDIKDLPPAQPQRPGRWIFDENDYLTKCSECGCHPWFGVIPTVKEATKKMPHCPMCLARMEDK